MNPTGHLTPDQLTATCHTAPKTGAVVAATYRTWENGNAWLGRVLDIDEPRAWFGTLAFPREMPTREQVSAHLDRTRELFALSGAYGSKDPFDLADPTNSIPVEWEFGQVYWETWPKLIKLD